VKAAGPRAWPGQDAPGHPLGRDQIGKLELDVHQLFTQVPGLPSELAAALPIRSSIQPTARPSRPELSSARRAINPDDITLDRHEHTRSAPYQPVQVGTISVRPEPLTPPERHLGKRQSSP